LGVDATPYILKPTSFIKNGSIIQDSHFGFIISGSSTPKNKVVPNSISNASLSVSVMNLTFTKGSVPTQAFLKQEKVKVQHQPPSVVIPTHQEKILAPLKLQPNEKRKKIHTKIFGNHGATILSTTYN
jgi:hypothetical protein